MDVNKAFRRLFLRRRQAFRTLFLDGEGGFNEAGKIVMAYLRRECHATVPTFDSDPLRMAFNEGKRAAYLEIMGQLNATEEMIYRLSEEVTYDE